MPFNAFEGFHVWAMEWKEGQVVWYLDGKVIRTYKGPTPQEKMFILMALFQYSSVPSWTDKIDPDMKYPRDFEIDYVRAYKREK
jgi:beta-glucanase (GH16 family)